MMIMLLIIISLIAVLANSNDLKVYVNYGINDRQHRSQFVNRKVAMFWVLHYAIPDHFDLAIATLANGGNKHMDLIIIGPPILSNKFSSGDMLKPPNVIFYEMTPEDWALRIFRRLGVQLNYTLSKHSGRKLADLKPMMGALFHDLIPIKKYSHWIYGGESINCLHILVIERVFFLFDS